MEKNNTLAFRALNLPGVGQLGFVVPNVEQALPVYASFYNLQTWFKPKYVETEVRIGGDPVDLELDLMVAFSGGTQIELITGIGRVDNPYQQFLEGRGAGLHHLGFFVSDLKGRLNFAEQLEIDVLMEGNFKTAGGGSVRFAYLDTQERCGIVLELLEIRLYGISVPQTSFMMNLGTLTGDVEKITLRT